MNLIHVGKRLQSQIDIKGRLYFSRRKAHSLRKKLIKERNGKVVDSKIIRTIKYYSNETFGSSKYWPWLALYTEIRGEFIPGWLPDDYYTVILLDKYCPLDARISNYKTFDHRLFPDFALKPLIVKVSGHFYDSCKNLISDVEASDILNKYKGEVVCKEDTGLGGNRVKFLESDRIQLRDFQNVTNFIIQPLVRHHEILKKLNPRAVSTLRVVTFLKDNGEIEIKHVFCRFGLGESRIDNTSNGGGFCPVSSGGRLFDIGYLKLGQEIGQKHPDTGVFFGSIKVPNYELILEKCLNSHNSYPYVRIIGWDVTINEDGDPLLLEWNADPGLWIAEAMYGPFWKDDLFSRCPPAFDEQNYSRSISKPERASIKV